MNEEFYNKPKSFTSNSQVDVRSSSFLSRVYGYMAVGIFISAIVAFAAAFGFKAWFDFDQSESAYMTYLYVLIGSFVGLLITSIVISFVSLRGKHSIIIPAIIYSILMGVVFSEFVLFVPFYIVGTAFAITAMTFGIMYFIGKVVKRNLNWLGTLGYGLLMGAFMLSIFFFILHLVDAFDWMYVLIDGAIFVAMLLITMYDV